MWNFGLIIWSQIHRQRTNTGSSTDEPHSSRREHDDESEDDEQDDGSECEDYQGLICGPEPFWTARLDELH